MILAQQTLDALPANYWKWFCISLLVLLGASTAVVLIIVSFRKPEPTRLHDDPPIEVRKSAKRYNHDLTEVRFQGIEVRVAKNEDQIEKINDLIRIDLPAMERRLDDANESRVSEVHHRVNQILEVVGEIKGQLKKS
jgi:hypothetical protein